PVHFYEPVPDTRQLSPELWEAHSTLGGIDLRTGEQLARLARFAASYRQEYEALPVEPTGDPTQYYEHNGVFASTDGEALYCMIRDYKPRRVIEIGSGFSSLLTAQALRKNADEGGPQGELVCVEPYPSQTLRRGFPGLTRLVAQPVQTVPLSLFDELEANDVLFIDSSHI